MTEPNTSFVLVPVEPDDGMTYAGLEAFKDGLVINDDAERTVRHAYRAMIAARPSPSVDAGEVEAAAAAVHAAECPDGAAAGFTYEKSSETHRRYCDKVGTAVITAINAYRSTTPPSPTVSEEAKP